MNATLLKIATVSPLTSRLTNNSSEHKWDMQGTSEDERIELVIFSYGLLHIDMTVLVDQQKFTWIRYVKTYDAAKKTC